MRSENVSTREDRIDGVSSSEDYGVGVRVIFSGAWGFAATPNVIPADAERVAQQAVAIARANAKLMKRPIVLAPEKPHVDVWQTPLLKDPFKIPLEDEPKTESRPASRKTEKPKKDEEEKKNKDEDKDK